MTYWVIEVGGEFSKGHVRGVESKTGKLMMNLIKSACIYLYICDVISTPNDIEFPNKISTTDPQRWKSNNLLLHTTESTLKFGNTTKLFSCFIFWGLFYLFFSITK